MAFLVQNCHDSQVRERLGPDFNRMWLASGISNIGDGVILGAVPVLVASNLTNNPILISSTVGITVASRVIASLPAGVWVDRHPRKRIFFRVSLARGAIVTHRTLACGRPTQHRRTMGAPRRLVRG